jgi:thioesterase domain-containing protein
VITDEEQEAIDTLPDFYGSVVPTTRRELAPIELADLFNERRVLDLVLAVVARRKEDIRTSVLNHFDVEAEKAGTVDAETPRDKDGHYILAADVPIPGAGVKYAWEVSQGAADISSADLKEALSHEDWLAVTEPVRVFDEHKAILHLKKRPQLLATLAGIVRPGKPKGAFNIRKVK